MSIAVTCPSGHLLKVADSMAGRAGRCPHCREIVQVPTLRRASDGEKSNLVSRSRLGRGPATSGATSPKLPPNGLPASIAPPPAVVSDPAAADTVLMPISPAEMPPPEEIAFPTQPSAADPDSPVVTDAVEIGMGPDQMAQTLPLPTAELVPRLAPGAPDPAHDVAFDTAAHKTRIVGSWKILGDVEPPYVPEQTANRSSVAATEISEPRSHAPMSVEKKVAVGPTSAARRKIPPLIPSAAPAVAATEPAPLGGGPTALGGAAARKNSWFRPSIAKDSPWPLRATVYRISAALVVVSIFSMWPALRYWDLGGAPGWARGALLVALLQLAYAAWLISIPDWASLWSMMIVLAIVATMYGTVAAMTLATPIERDPPLGLQSVRHIAPYWCAVIMLLTVGAAYLCGHAAQCIRRVAGHAK